jgi:TatD DNase family protein
VIDTHAHLEMCDGEPEDVAAAAADAGVSRILTIGREQAVGLAEQIPGVWAVVGVHPHEAAEVGDPAAAVRELIGHPRAVAVGECGLDFYRDYAPRDRQRELFERQLELAAELGKPVVVHTRAASEETAAALEPFSGTVVLHCFSAPELLPVALERGYYLSFAGNVTYPKAGELREAACAVPGERLLAETDSPYLSPQPRRGRPNEPANVVHTIAALAEARSEEATELAARLDANASAAFGLA